MDDVFASQVTDRYLASFVEVKDVTPAFNAMGQQIYVIKHDILG